MIKFWKPFFISAFFLLLHSLTASAEIKQISSSKLRLTLDTVKHEWQVSEIQGGAILTVQKDVLVKVAQNYLPTQISDVKVDRGVMRVQLTSTNPVGVLEATFRFSQIDVLEIKISSKNLQADSLGASFEDRQEHYYGVWETPHSGNLDNRGAQAEFEGTQGAPNVNYSSARAPFYMTSAKYGVYVRSHALGRFSFAKEGKTQFEFDAPHISYVIIYGPSYAEILSKYNAISGPAILPPLWGFGPGWWRDDLHVGFHGAVSNAQENLMDDVVHLEQLHIPASFIWLDRPYGTGTNGWGSFDFDPSFPNPKKMIEDSQAHGVNLLLWIANKAWNPGDIWRESLAQAYLFKNVDASAVNVENPKAYQFFKTGLEKYVNMGIKGYKIDRGEEDQDQVPNYLKNLMHITFAKMAGESLQSKFGNDYLVLTRNLNDDGRKYAVLWGGDPQCTFAGLQASMTEGLRSGLINFPLWGSDTGGYLCDKISKDIFARWFAFGAYSPIMEIMIGAERTPWYDFDAEFNQIVKLYSDVHHDLLPYIRDQAYQATLTGMPVMRPLLFSDPSNPKLVDLSDEYMYGSELLVAPVVTAAATSRSVYLPAGNWWNYSAADSNDHTVYQGGSSYTVAAPLASIPVFVREGAIIPRGDILKANNEWTSSWTPHLRIQFFPSPRVGNRQVYFDGVNGHEISLTPQGGIGAETLIEFNDLGVATELEIHCRGVDTVSQAGVLLKLGKDYTYDSQKMILRIPLATGSSAKLDLHGLKSLWSASP